MRLVPGATSTSFPSIVSLGTVATPDQRFELVAELLHVADVGADGAVVERADRRARAALGDVEDRIEILLAPFPFHDPVSHLVDPAGGFPARGALSARLVGVEARHDHQRVGNRYRVVHYDDASGADHRADVLQTVRIHRDVDLICGQDGGGGSARDDGLEPATVRDAATFV